MKILYVTTVGETMDFFKSITKQLIDDGHIVDIATNELGCSVAGCYREWGCKIYQISTSRSPFSIGNIKAIGAIKKIAKDYDVIHCHTPIAAAVTRITCKNLREKGLKVIYTAHGFHFYNGAPLKNWMIYYPIEKICSQWTDTIITINSEDYALAKEKMKAKQIEYVPGVGIDVCKFANTVVDKKKKKRELGLSENSKVILSVGELNENKNHKLVIEALSKIENSNICYLIAGTGDQKEKLERLAQEHNVNLKLLGYRTDVAELYKTADLFVLPSIREGLNVSTMEAMAAGCPAIVSRIRGNTDMVPSENCFDPFKVDELAELLQKNKIENGDFIEKINYSVINKKIKKILGV